MNALVEAMAKTSKACECRGRARRKVAGNSLCFQTTQKAAVKDTPFEEFSIPS